MSQTADFDLKERVRNAVDIVDVVGRDLELRPQGRNFVARCPFHDDRRPSMTVNQERQVWKCWVCDIGGDIFSFIMRREGVDFPTALRMLAESAGIAIEQYSSARGKPVEPGSPSDKATLWSALRVVADAYFNLLDADPGDELGLAREYLAERGIDEESRQRFRIGYAPNDWSFAVDTLRRHNFSGEVAEAAGLALARTSGGHYDRFRGRLIFPIHDLQDRPISLGGRIVPAIAAARDGEEGGGAKYINGPETQLFRKSQQLYGLQLARDAIRRRGEVLVMEGYTDVVAARQFGIEPVVAVLGTALGDDHLKLLKRFADRVVLVLDGDDAGQRRADEVTEVFVRADVDLRVLTLPSGQDPADFLAAQGRDAFDALVRSAPDALDHRLERLTAGIDVTRDTHLVTTAVDKILDLLAQAPRSAGLRTDQLLVRLSRTFGLPNDKLRARLDSLRERRQRYSRSSRAGVGGSAAHSSYSAGQTVGADSRSESPALLPDAPQSLSPVSGLDRELFETLIEAPELAAIAIESIDPDWLDSLAAKMMLSAYQDLDLAGHALDFTSLLLVIESDALKSQLVTLEDRVRQRAGRLSDNTESRYTAIMTRYREREFAAEKGRQIARLESAELPQDEELALLEELILAERSRQGIVERSDDGR